MYCKEFTEVTMKNKNSHLHSPTAFMICNQVTFSFPGNEYTINVKFNVPPNQVGCYAGEVFFKFVPDNGQEFLMLRYVRCNKSDEVTKMLQPTSSYAPPVIPRLAEAEKIDLGEPLER